MNKVILMGRLTADPDVRYSQGENSRAVARYRLAVDRRRPGANGQREADFISCVAFDKAAEFAERYLHKGTKIAITGRIQTGSYTDRNGQKVYTTDVIIEEQEFAESKSQGGGYQQNGQQGGYQQSVQQQNSYQQNRNNQPGKPVPPSAPSYANEQMHLADGFYDIPDDVNDEGLPFN